MDFKEILKKAQQGDQTAISILFLQYRPLIWKLSRTPLGLDEDLFQELSLTFLYCIRSFQLRRWEMPDEEKKKRI